MMPAGGRDALKGLDAIYFGAVGAPDVPDHVSLWGLRLAICQGFDQYANVRPARILPGITSPLRGVTARELDWVIVRENSEGEYAGVGGRVHRGLPEEVATDVSVMTRAGVARIMRFAFALARVAAAQAADGRHQVERPAPRHGDVGRDRGRGGRRIPRRDLGQDAGRRHDHAHGAQAADARHHRRHATCMPTSSPTWRRRWRARSASRRPRTSTRSAASPRCSSRSTARPSTSPARASPTRSARSGRRRMMLEHLGEPAAAARLMRAIERVTADDGAAHAGSRGQGDDAAGDGGGGRRD